MRDPLRGAPSWSLIPTAHIALPCPTGKTPARRASGQPPSELESGAYIIGGQLAELSGTPTTVTKKENEDGTRSKTVSTTKTKPV